MDRLVLDTNQIVEKDWRLRSAAMRLIEKAIAVDFILLVIPEIVVEETKNKFRQKLQKHINDFEDTKGEISRLIDSTITVSLPELDDECQKYYEDFDERLTELTSERPKYSNVEHKWLVAKAFGPHRPFKDGDRGYRDALVWHSVVRDVASTEHKTYFVSENKKDFANSEGELHEDLINELKGSGLDGHVIYMHNLQTFVEEVVKPALEKIPTPVTAEEFEELFEKQLDLIIGQLRESIDKQGLPGVSNELFLSGAYIYQLGLVSADAKDAYKLNDSSYYTSFDVLVEASFEQTVYAPDAVWLAESMNISGATGGDERTTELDFTLMIPLTIAVVASTEQGVEPEISIELTEFYGYCRHCRHPVVHDAAERCSDCKRSLL